VYDLNMKTAVLLINMGGPDSLNDVEPYLANIFKDPNIFSIPLGPFRKSFAKWFAHRRATKSKKIYESIGGKSPLLSIAQKQSELLERALITVEPHEYFVFTAMRYWNPYVADVWAGILQQGFERIICVSMYPFFSLTTTTGIEQEIKSLQKQYCPDWSYHCVQGGQPVTSTPHSITFIDRMGNHPLFLSGVLNQVLWAHQMAQSEGKAFHHLVFSVHSIPVKSVQNGDTYQIEVEQALYKLMTEIPTELNVYLGYQSKLGPVEWLSPSTEDLLISLGKRGVKDVMMYPLGFVADNSETIYEIAQEYAQLAKQNGIERFETIPALNDNTHFIRLLSEIVTCSAGNVHSGTLATGSK
jgi:protoporphyrin/coproporphyrin ferrochelatase